MQLVRRFPDDPSAEQWLVSARWPAGPRCPRCHSPNVWQRPSRKPQPFRCRACRKDFSVKSDTLMHNSKLGCQVWVVRYGSESHRGASPRGFREAYRATTKQRAQLYSDEAAAYAGMEEYRHEAVKHSAGERARPGAHQRRGVLLGAAQARIVGTFHHVSERHLALASSRRATIST